MLREQLISFHYDCEIMRHFWSVLHIEVSCSHSMTLKHYKFQFLSYADVEYLNRQVMTAPIPVTNDSIITDIESWKQ